MGKLNIDIDRKIAERADEFAEREYECGADERAHLSKGYYWGYKDAQKDLALTPGDVKKILKFARASIADALPHSLSNEELAKEVLRRFNEQKKK